MLLFLSSPAVFTSPVGSRAAVPHCCLITRRWWTVPLKAQVTWSALSPVKGDLPFRSAMGSTSGPWRWVGNPRSLGPCSWGGKGLMLLSWPDCGRASVFKSFERNSEDSKKEGEAWLYRKEHLSLGRSHYLGCQFLSRAAVERKAYSILLPCSGLPVRKHGPHLCLQDENATV